MKKAMVIYSGGLDSTVLLYQLEREFRYLQPLFFNYGSKHNVVEYLYAYNICYDLNIRLWAINIETVGASLESHLLKHGGEIPTGKYDIDNMKKTIVPFRNGILLSIAAGIAESNGFDYLYYGAHAGDHDIYPDCRPEFIDAMILSIATGTDNKVYLRAPFMNMKKSEIVKLGHSLNVSFEKTWSCYKGQFFNYGGKEIYEHCGQCSTCLERQEAFKIANVIDKTTYSGGSND